MGRKGAERQEGEREREKKINLNFVALDDCSL